MAEMLRDADSSERHLAVVYRHIRLCKRMNGADFLVANITPAHAALHSAAAATQQALLDKEGASDDLLFQRWQAADLVRSIFARAQIFDRNHPANRALPILFPEEAFGDYITPSGIVYTETLQLFLPRIASLGPGHELAGLAAEVSAQISAAENAEAALKQAVMAYHLKSAEEEVAQRVLRVAYEANYLDARKALGRLSAERVFPRFRRRSQAGDENDGSGAEPENTAPANPAP